MTSHYHQPINITAKEWRNYELQSLARACVNLARINQRLTRLTTALCQRQPTITCGQHYHWLSYELDSVPFLVVHQSQPVVKLTRSNYALPPPPGWSDALVPHRRGGN